MESISNEQIKDASGSFLALAHEVGAQTSDQHRLALNTPTYEDAAIALGQTDIRTGHFIISAQVARRQVAVLEKMAGLRVLAAVVDSLQRQAFLPGVIVVDKGVRVGCLNAAPDVRTSDSSSITAGFSDYQQLLLGKIYAQHQVGGGHHAESITTEINHASVIAASDGVVNAHSLVHSLVDRGSFSSQLASTGATSIETTHGTRPNSELILSMSRVAGLVIARHYQAPLPMTGDSFDLSAGFTLAAKRTQGKGANNTLQRNMEHML